MSQKQIEVILSRHLSSYLATPVFIVDPLGNLLYYNEAAEAILGKRFDETGEMTVDEWGTIFQPMSADGTPLAPEDLPLVKTLKEKRPRQGGLWIRGLDHVLRHIEVFAYPLIGQANRYLGAVAMFWESDE